MSPIEFMAMIEQHTQAARAPFAAITLSVVIYCIFALWKNDKDIISGIPRKYIYGLALTFVVAFVIRVVIYPHHAGMMNDDFYNMQHAKMILDPNFHPFNPFEKSIGWPFLLSILFWPLGLNQYTAYFANSIFGALTVIPLFLLAKRTTDSNVGGILAAFVFAVHPLHSMWSICGENNVVSIFFMVIALAALFGFFIHHTHEYIYLSLFSASFAAQTRVEHFILFLFIPIGIYFLCRALFSFRRIVAVMWIPVALAIPNLLHEIVLKMSTNWTLNDTKGAVTGANVSLDNLVSNLGSEMMRIRSGDSFSSLIVLLALVGIVVGWKYHKKIIVFFGALGATYFVMISLLWKTLACRERFFLYTDVCLVLIGCFVLKYLVRKYKKHEKIIVPVLLLLIAAFSLHFHVRNIDPGYDYFYYGRKMTDAFQQIIAKSSENTIIVVGDPAPIQALSDIMVMLPDVALDNIEKLGDHEDLYYLCYIPGDPSYERIRQAFQMQIIMPLKLGVELTPDSSRFGYYKIIPR